MTERDRNVGTKALSWDLLTRPCGGGTRALAPAKAVPSVTQRGFTLVETAIAVGLLSTLVIAIIIGLAHRAGSFETSREQIVAFFTMAKARAATNADASGNTGVTIIAAYAASSDMTTISLYEGRPFGGRLTPALPAVVPLVVQGRLALGQASSSGQGTNVAVFIGASGAASALGNYDLNQTALASEPPCIYASGLQLPLTVGQTTQTLTLSCATGEVLPDPSSPSQQRGSGGGESRTPGTHD